MLKGKPCCFQPGMDDLADSARVNLMARCGMNWIVDFNKCDVIVVRALEGADIDQQFLVSCSLSGVSMMPVGCFKAVGKVVSLWTFKGYAKLFKQWYLSDLLRTKHPAMTPVILEALASPGSKTKVIDESQALKPAKWKGRNTSIAFVVRKSEKDKFKDNKNVWPIHR